MVTDNHGGQVDGDEPRTSAEFLKGLLDVVPVAGQPAHPVPARLALPSSDPDAAQAAADDGLPLGRPRANALVA